MSNIYFEFINPINLCLTGEVAKVPEQYARFTNGTNIPPTQNVAFQPEMSKRYPEICPCSRSPVITAPSFFFIETPRVTIAITELPTSFCLSFRTILHFHKSFSLNNSQFAY